MCSTITAPDGRGLGVTDVLKLGFKRLRSRFNFSDHQWTTFNAIIACRSGRLGAHLLRCTQCKRFHLIPLSCRNRHCPSCQGAAAKKWLESQEQALLPVPYFHVVFTLPHTLNPLVRVNPNKLHPLLFNAAAQTLQKFGKNNLEAQLGITAVLHTWGQTLCEHYHLHCIVTGGGLSLDESRWVSPPGDKPYLFCTKALSKVFRGKYLAGLKKLYADGKLEFHGKSEAFQKRPAFNHLVRSEYRQDWVVYSKAPFAGPRQVLAYLSRYTHRVAISDGRIVSLNAQRKQVTISYKNYRQEGRWQQLVLDVETFIKRLSLHILPKRFTKIRHYGILSNPTRKAKIAVCRQLLGAPDKSDSAPMSEDQSSLPTKCPYCECETLVYFEITYKPVRISRERAPPMAA